MVKLVQKSDSNFPDTIPYLPQNYNFEINKTLRTITRYNAKKVTLQFPDGLLRYSLAIVDTITKYTGAECIILNDVVYGACCIDDISLPSDLLIHYGHSCLIPVNEMNTKVLYVFVDIKIDIEHLYRIIKDNFTENVAILGTITYNSSVNKLKKILNSSKDLCKNIAPQIKPLSPGEVLGCTSPIIKDVQTVISIGDGRFHLESVMVNNPLLNFYKYCPFSRKLTKEFYDYGKMVEIRTQQIKKAFNGKSFGLILGTLGRQGNKQILKNIKNHLKSYKLYLLMMDEIDEDLLERYAFIDSFIQISCPRLSMDWGHNFKKPLLSPFEVFYKGGSYLLDYYSKEGNSPWKNYNNN